jgi:hypothetical protein
MQPTRSEPHKRDATMIIETERSPAEIVEQTNELARQLYAIRGYTVESGYCFYEATHPDEVAAWEGARAAQLLLTDTDPEDALEELQ